MKESSISVSHQTGACVRRWLKLTVELGVNGVIGALLVVSESAEARSGNELGGREKPETDRYS